MADTERAGIHIPSQGRVRPGGDTFSADQVQKRLILNSNALIGPSEKNSSAIKKDSNDQQPSIFTLERPLVTVNIHFSSETLLDESLDLRKRWKDILAKPPEKSLGAEIFRFEPNLVNQAIAAVIPGMIEFRMWGDPNQAFTQIGEAVLTKTTVKPEDYFVNISGVRPKQDDEPITHAIDSIEQMIEPESVINIRKTFGEIEMELLGIETKLYLSNGENYYVVDIDPDIDNPFQLAVNQRSNRTSPVTFKRAKETLAQDLTFFQDTVINGIVQRITRQKAA